jgi:hypothetical protein
MRPLKRLSLRRDPKVERFSLVGWVDVDPSAKLPNAPIGEKPALPGVDHVEPRGLAPGAPPVVLLFSPPKGVDDSAFSLSRSSAEVLVAPTSFASVRRRSRAVGGVAAPGSSLKRDEPAGDEDGNGNAVSFSRRLLPDLVEVGEVIPNTELLLCPTEALR